MSDLISYHKVTSFELDSWGHVNNSVYLNYLEKARNDYLNQRGLPFSKFKEWGVFPVLLKSVVEYKQPAFADDELVIHGTVSDHSAITFTLQYTITRKDNDSTIAIGETRHVFVNKSNKPTRIPREFFEKFIK